MNEWVIIIPSLFVITILLTILDLYPLIRSFWFFATPSYYILLLTLFVLNLLAAYILKNHIFKSGDLIAVLVFASLLTFAVIQSFILKFGNYKVINLPELIDDFKVTVLNDTGKIVSKRERLKTLTMSKRLSEKKIDAKELETELYLLLSQKRSGDKAQEIVSRMKSAAGQAGLNLTRLLADRIAQMDLERAQLLVKDC